MKSGVTWLFNAFGDLRKGWAVARAYRRMLDARSEDGRLILQDLARYCGATQSAFAPTPHETAFNAGRQDVFFHVIEMAGLKPRDFPELLMETNDAHS